MNKEGYKIMDIRGGQHSRFGEIVIVRANPIIKNGFSSSIMASIYEDTEYFYFPVIQSILNRLLMIGNGGGKWQPFEEDFFDESVFDRDQQKNVTVHFHNSFYDEPYDASLNCDQEISLIRDMGYKANTLYDQYIKNYLFESYYSFRQYVESLAESDGSFFSWLFNRSDLNGYEPWNWPSEYLKEFENFLVYCDKKYGNDLY